MDQSSAPQSSSSAVSPPSPIPVPNVPAGPTVVVSSAAASVPVTAPNVAVAPVNTQNVVHNPFTPPMPSTNYTYASFFRRYVASMLDGIILGVINAIISLSIGFGAGIAFGSSVKDFIGLPISLISLIISISLVYYLYFIGDKGQTPGKMALGIKVVKLDASVKVGYTSAFLREFIGKIISLLVFGLGYLWMLWDSKKQTWHDKIANTVVIRV